MITKPTVFVLGAGVSMPYGFPSGGQLVKQICAATFGIPFEDDNSGLLDKGDVQKILHDVFGELEAEKFGSALHYSQRYSIDSFLERRPEFTEIGKWAISLFILRKEISTSLFSFENQDKGCYRYLFEKLDTSWDELTENKVSFITFNYDRSLEHFLFTTLQKSHGKSENECVESIKQIPVIHIHGSLGKLPWQEENGLPYGSAIQNSLGKNIIGYEAASKASKEIKVIPENQKESKELSEAFELLYKAKRIYFLGFSYHNTNLERLNINRIAKVERQVNTTNRLEISRMKGTGFGLEKKELEAVKKWFINVPDPTIDALLFLKRHADLD